jgi:hypothetical protein
MTRESAILRLVRTRTISSDAVLTLRSFTPTLLTEGSLNMVNRFQRQATAALVAITLMICTGAPAAAPAKKSAPFNVVPMMVSSVTVSGGQLVANVLVGSRTIVAPISLTPGAVPAGGACPVLNLSLGPINLELLGLHVDTSAVCLKLTAHQGGGLLGDVLCLVANLLSGPTPLPLATILSTSLTPAQLDVLNSGLTQVLNQAVFIPLSRSDALASAACQVLHLELGPLDLNLLGLQVELNNCGNGPVVLDVTAQPGGGLLGDLLCGLSNLLSGGSTAKILAVLQNIATLLGSLLG